jgi:hypothetical protein
MTIDKTPIDRPESGIIYPKIGDFVQYRRHVFANWL